MDVCDFESSSSSSDSSSSLFESDNSSDNEHHMLVDSIKEALQAATTILDNWKWKLKTKQSGGGANMMVVS
jgi:hypothetical protein